MEAALEQSPLIPLPYCICLVVLRGEPIAYTYEMPEARHYMMRVGDDLQASRDKWPVWTSRCPVTPEDIGATLNEHDCLWVVLFEEHFDSAHRDKQIAYEKAEWLRGRTPDRDIRCVHVPRA